MKTLSSTTWQIPAHIRLGRFISSTATSLAASMVAPAVSSMTEGIRKPLGRFLNIGGDGRGHADGMCVEGPSLQGEELHALMKEQQEKFTDPAIAHNFKGWNKTMLYYFPDIDEYYVLPIKDGEGQGPEKVAEPPRKPEIYYEMSTETLRAMTRGEISGFKAYQERKLKLKASFTDMMKLQSLNKV